MKSFHDIVDLRKSSDPLACIDRIEEGVSLRGYNLWLLFCSAALASIGLDTNSTAVIIGAMLISPLMSPILGIGLSLGIHDKQLLLKSARNLAVAVVLALIASTLYFSISPFGNATAEIESRTFPTLLDVMVALFGGLAGIISMSRSGSSIALPGVAIATALMPPLCTAGYGIATAQWTYFGGAFYLFFINAVFISLATFLIVTYLQFPHKVYRTRSRQKMSNIIFTMLVLVVSAPSIYFLFTVYERENAKRKIQQLVINPIRRNDNEVFKWEIEKKDSATLIKVYHSGKPLSDSLRQSIADQLRKVGMETYQLEARRVNMTREEINELSAGVIRNMFQQMEMQQTKSPEPDYRSDTLPHVPIGHEIRIAFDFIDTSYNGWLTIPVTGEKTDTLPVLFYSARRITETEKARLYKYLLHRWQVDTVVLIRR